MKSANQFLMMEKLNRSLQLIILICLITSTTLDLHAKDVNHSDSYYDSIYHVMLISTNEADFRSFYEVIRLDENFPENLKHELILITMNKAKTLGFDYAYACGLFHYSMYKSIIGQYGEAISMASTSIDIFTRLKDYGRLSASYNTLGSTLTASGDPEAGKKCLRKAIEINKQVACSKRQTLMHIDNLIVLGYIYYNAKQLDSAELVTRSALALANRTNPMKVDYYNLYREKAYCYINLGKFQLKQHHYAEAINLYEKGLALCKMASSEGLEATFHHRIGQVYQAMKEWDVALSHFDKGIQKCSSYFTILPIWINLLKIKAETLEMKGEYAQAVLVQKRHIALKDSLNSINKEKEMQKLIIEFKVKQKDLEIASLNQQATIKSLKLAQRNNQLIAVEIALVMIAIGGYLYYRQSKFKNEKAKYALEQRFLRAQLNPHFIFNSMTTIQHYMLQYDTENAGNYMGMFSTLMRQILENSREEFIPLKEEVNMLRTYIELQRIRFADSFSYTIEVDEAIDDEYVGVPPMFAQPFIENVFEHGLFKKSDCENKLSIRFSLANPQQILLAIEDSGIGIQQKMPTSFSSHKSLATTITEERLQNLNQSNQQKSWISFENLTGEEGLPTGCRVTLYLPIKVLAHTPEFEYH